MQLHATDFTFSSLAPPLKDHLYNLPSFKITTLHTGRETNRVPKRVLFTPGIDQGLALPLQQAPTPSVLSCPLFPAVLTSHSFLLPPACLHTALVFSRQAADLADERHTHTAGS